MTPSNARKNVFCFVFFFLFFTEVEKKWPTFRPDELIWTFTISRILTNLQIERT